MPRPEHISSINTAFDQPRRYYASMSGPPSPSSPLARTPLMPDSGSMSDEDSPAPTVIMTPTHTGHASSTSPPRGFDSYFKSDHTALSSLSQMPSPTISTDAEYNNASSKERVGSFPFPLLPPHHPLRNKMFSASPTSDTGRSNDDNSPPTTPKGHPLESKIRYPKDLKSKMHSISRPYGGALAYPRLSGMAIPGMRGTRRMRPYFLVMFCCFVFGIVLVNNAASNAAATIRGAQQHPVYLDSHAHKQAVELGKRQEEMAELKDKREKSRFWVLAEMAEKAIQAPVAAPITFQSTQEELAAVLAFVTSTTANALPELDPTVPLDPAVVLDFDPNRPGAREDLELLVNEVNTVYPLVLVGKMRDPWYREIKKMLAEYKITPAPLTIDVDQRRDHRTFIPLLARLLGTEELPQLLLKGESLGSYHDVASLQGTGELAKTLEAGGLVVREQKKKKKGVKERERIENERVLGPEPIQDE